MNTVSVNAWRILMIVVLGMAWFVSSSDAALLLDYFNTGTVHAKDDFTGYTVTGAQLAGQGSGLGTGLTGNWAGLSYFITDNSLHNFYTAPPSGYPAVFADSAGAGIPYFASRSLASPLQYGQLTEFIARFSAGMAGDMSAGWALTDASNNAIAGYTGTFQKYDYHLLGPNSTWSATFAGGGDKSWYTVYLRGVISGGSLTKLYLYAFPNASTDLDTGWSLSMDVNTTTPIAGVQLRLGDLTTQRSGQAGWDDFELRTFAAIPEPASGLLLALGAGLFLKRRARG